MMEENANGTITTHALDVDKEGTCKKQGGKFKTWKQRYYVIVDLTLFWFEKLESLKRFIDPSDDLINVHYIEQERREHILGQVGLRSSSVRLRKDGLVELFTANNPQGPRRLVIAFDSPTEMMERRGVEEIKELRGKEEEYLQRIPKYATLRDQIVEGTMIVRSVSPLGDSASGSSSSGFSGSSFFGKSSSAASGPPQSSVSASLFPMNGKWIKKHVVLTMFYLYIFKNEEANTPELAFEITEQGPNELKSTKKPDEFSFVVKKPLFADKIENPSVGSALACPGGSQTKRDMGAAHAALNGQPAIDWYINLLSGNSHSSSSSSSSSSSAAAASAASAPSAFDHPHTFQLDFSVEQGSSSTPFSEFSEALKSMRTFVTRCVSLEKAEIARAQAEQKAKEDAERRAIVEREQAEERERLRHLRLSEAKYVESAAEEDESAGNKASPSNISPLALSGVLSSGSSAPAEKQRTLESFMQDDPEDIKEMKVRLRKGVVLVKHGNQGKPHKKLVYFEWLEKRLTWEDEKKGTLSHLVFPVKLFRGQQTELFLKRGDKKLADLCFSLVNYDRSLDLQCSTVQERDEICNMIERCMNYEGFDVEKGERMKK